jgi:hypothetical protein
VKSVAKAAASMASMIAKTSSAAAFPLESHLCSSLCFYGGGPDLLRLRRFGRVRHDVVAVERVQTVRSRTAFNVVRTASR